MKEDSEQLSAKKGELLHLVVTELLFIINRYRSDLDMAVRFLMTRLLKSDIDNWDN